MRVGIIGVGMVGAEMALGILRVGHSLTACARSGDHPAITAAGGIVTSSPAEAAASEILILCVFDDDQIRSLVSDSVFQAMAPGSLLVVHTTGDPLLFAELADRIPAGVELLDATFSGSAPEAKAASLVILAGGERGMLDRARPVLSSYANRIFHVGVLGDGRRLKLVNNLLFTANLQLAAKALSVAEGLGFDSAMAAEALEVCSGGSWAIHRLASADSVSNFLNVSTRYLQKDIAAVRAAADHAGVDLGLLADVVGQT